MLATEIVRSDGNPQNLEHPFIDRLVSNLAIFNQNWPIDKIKNIEHIDEMVDDSNDVNLPTLEEVIENFNPERDKGQAFVCLAEDNTIWSSSKDKRNGAGVKGYDRPEETNYDNYIKYLKDNTIYSDQIGYKSAKAGVSQGYIRFTEKETLPGAGYKAYYCTLVKDQGNGRFFMKKLVAKGDKTYHKIEVRFHEVDADIDECHSIEARAHSADANDRNNQNEKQKFASLVSSGDPNYVDLANWLEQHELNYDEFFDEPTWPKLSAVGGMVDGLKKGAFHRYGKINLDMAVNTCKELLTKEHQKTQDGVILHSTIMMLASMYESFVTTNFKSIHDDTKGHYDMRLTPQEMHEFFIEEFDYRNEKSRYKATRKSDGLKLHDLTGSGSTKSLEFVACQIFWHELSLPRYYADLKGHETKLFLSANCDPVQHFLKKIGNDSNIGDRLLRKAATDLVTTT